MSVHKIRLAGPWEWSPVDSSGECSDLTEAQTRSKRQTCQLPFQFVKDHGCLPISLVRRFHCPTGISEKTTICVALEVSRPVIQVRLNGRLVSEDSQNAVDAPGVPPETATYSQRFDVSGALKPFNELNVLLSPMESGEMAELISVNLEIRE